VGEVSFKFYKLTTMFAIAKSGGEGVFIKGKRNSFTMGAF
jgi:hypothetical protein